MNQFGVILVWCAVQVTIVSVAAAVVYLAARRFGPPGRSLVAASAMAVIVALSALSASPWPQWKRARTQTIAQETPRDADKAADTTSGNFGSSDQPEERGDVDDASRSAISPIETAGNFFATFADELQHVSSAEATVTARAPTRRWPAVAACVFLTGLGLGLLRLAGGLAFVSMFRRRSRVLNDALLLETVDVLRAELGVRRAVELCESDRLDSPATAGWRRPAILLPAGWRNWSREELRAVLAHELAHVRRSDFAVWMIAQVGLLLHFYHPLVHWLCSRLRLEQELAADSCAAELSGGRKSYLTILAGMALDRTSGERQTRCAPWPARAFLPTQSTFLRRIEMLKDSKRLTTTLSFGRRTATVALLAVAGLFAAGFRGAPASDADAESSRAENGTVKFSAADDVDRPRAATGGDGMQATPFSLSWIPTDAVFAGAVRPAAVLSRPAFKPVVEALKEDGNPFVGDFGVDLTEVESITWSHLPGKTAEGPPVFGGFVVRTNRAHNVAEHLRKQKVEEKTLEKGFPYYVAENRSTACVVVDDRTFLIVDDEAAAGRLLAAGKTGASEAEWAKEWKRVETADLVEIAVVTKFRDAVEREYRRMGPPMLAFLPLFTKTNVVAGAVKAREGLDIQVEFSTENAEDARTVHDTVKALATLGGNILKTTRDRFETLEAEAADAGSRRRGPSRGEVKMTLDMIELGEGLLANLKVETNGTRVRLASTGDEGAAQIVAAMIPAVRAARAAARRSQAKSSLKNIALAMHNYHSLRTHFPAAKNVIDRSGKKTEPHSWRVALLPDLNQKKLYDEYRFDEPWDSEHNKTLIAKMPKIYRNPGDPADSTNSAFYVLTGEGTMFPGEKSIKLLDVHDGTSNTIMIVEARRKIPWTKPEDIPFDAEKPLPELGGFHTGGFNAALGDGSVKFISENIDKKILRLLITISDGTPVGEF